MRNAKGQFVKGHPFGRRFVKGNNSPVHKEFCNCFRCSRTVWNKGRKGTGFGLYRQNIFKPRKFSVDEKNFVKIICKNCYDEFKDYESNKRKFCSRKCRFVYHSLYERGEKSYNYKHGRANTIEYLRERNRERRMRENSCEGSHTGKEWEKLKKTYKNICLCCKREEPEIKLTEDHIVPISKGGTDYIWNIQPLCKSCNSRKNIKEIDYRIYLNN